MDFEIHPNDWKFEKTICFSYIRNKTADVEIAYNDYNSDGMASCKIAGLEVGITNRNKIRKAFESRHAADVLERLIDRIQNVTTVSVEDVVEEVRPKEIAKPKTVDPFEAYVAPMDVLSKHLEALKRANTEAKALPPPPLKIAGPTTKPKVIQPGPHTDQGTAYMTVMKRDAAGKVKKMTPGQTIDLMNKIAATPGKPKPISNTSRNYIQKRYKKNG
jgi:hypothetical protein